MPYGLKDPEKILTAAGEAAIWPESFDKCPICGRDTSHDGERYPLGRIRFPHNASEDVEVKIALGCQHCYLKQVSCNYFSIEELKVSRTMYRGRGRKPNTLKTYDKKPSATHVVQSSNGDSIDSILHDLQKIVARLKAMKSVAPSAAEPVIEEPSQLGDDEFIDSLLLNHQGEIEQDARDAALKATLVPEEWWNGKTTREILEITAEKRGLRYNEESGQFETYDF